ncbi:uncharacterized protein (UPF0332 family) [Methanomicrobium sp. W14]|uniref:hypothetical protein n=1 Tax=Methanomicrobium sp. W14 TaxID=2817839 RepID=UPI001FD8A052|nr:hypothetical protein [Methanomicrobium sp. W14]MBP2133013.1 uncharacterized protein (UPF0332 family) [Methanomicrobium sp. W14]
MVSAASAANFDKPVVKVIPDKTSYAPGDNVIVKAEVKLASSGDDTFPDAHTLEAITELEDPKWVYTVKVNDHGEENEVTRKTLDISGYLLDYPSDDNEVTISYTLEGKVPQVTSTGNITFVQITQYDGNGNIVSSGKYTEERLVVNPDDIDKLSNIVKGDLGDFESQLEDKLVAGVDTTAAQSKYDSAKELYTQAATASYSDANELLSKAQTLIKDGETLLNKAWAQKEIDDAQSTINSVSFYVTDFKVNRSMTNDARVINIETKLESAQSSLNSAQSMINNGNYAQAYTLADTSNSKAEEALETAQSIYEEVSKGIIPDIGGAGIFLIIGIIIVVAIVGIVIYRRYTSWDELG